MIGRISSFNNYQSVQNDLRRQEGKVQHNQAQLASGKKLLAPSDDPLATHYIQSIGQQEEQLKQYMDGIVLARNRLEHHEVILSNAEDYADDAKRMTMEMINGALSPEDRDAHKRELKELSANFLSLANSQDENGNYIFAGTKPKNQPFVKDADGHVDYIGDNYQRKMRIANNIDMPTSTPGNQLFMDIPNPFGDFEPEYQLQKGSELLLNHASDTNSDDSSKYKVTFVEMKKGKFAYQLEKNGSVVQATDYDPKKGISYKGFHVQLKGQVTPGDSIELEPRKKFNVFDTFKNAMHWSESSVSDASATAKLHQIVKEFHTAFIHLTKARTDVGTRLNTLDIQEQNHGDFKISLAKSKSNFEDLDYSKAIIDFTENTRALQASQQAFGKTKNLSLFNYI